ncbi:glycine cleavage system aminomethyltransferase GcvT [Ornithinibacillus gellani]|uniref:glycine cleavage system aminomethyltransferase GcvT n=1 Tax=Ornithinibacillus gellani TaxID=2293253 RepID=UPI000F493E02|nr:glycine cleavage system aminomethyltransferase GcvT [Ornithinibacillus gellani]TQS74531.1 glycine cleavage system aminomethyltransferase GcvT [Ornithinibacillus gellani]
MSELKRTPLFPEYEKYGAKTIDFGGWDLPVQFSSIKQEHEATRTKAGLFDVSHMGEIRIQGDDSLAFLQKMVTNDVSKLKPNRAQYTFMCYEDGGTVDDFLIYMLKEKDYLLVVNAANTDKDYEWLVQHQEHESVTIENVSDNYALLALQGPKAEEILQALTETDLSQIKFFGFQTDVQIGSVKDTALVSRTGYTGEDGFEIYIDQAAGARLWNELLDSGKDEGLVPVGLGARDTLRFEANLPLYGQELSKDISPIEAGLKFAVKVDKAAEFIGKDILKKQVEEGPTRKLVAIEMIDKGIPRTGYDVLVGEDKIGFVTSGTQSPTLKKNIGLALVDSKYTEVGTELFVQVRKRQLKSVIIKKPFLSK